MRWSYKHVFRGSICNIILLDGVALSPEVGSTSCLRIIGVC